MLTIVEVLGRFGVVAAPGVVPSARGSAAAGEREWRRRRPPSHVLQEASTALLDGSCRSAEAAARARCGCSGLAHSVGGTAAPVAAGGGAVRRDAARSRPCVRSGLDGPRRGSAGRSPPWRRVAAEVATLACKNVLSTVSDEVVVVGGDGGARGRDGGAIRAVYPAPKTARIHACMCLDTRRLYVHV